MIKAYIYSLYTGFQFYTEQVSCQFFMKTLIAVPVSIYMEYFYGITPVIITYLILSAIDLCFGSLAAGLHGTWNQRKLNHYLIKVGTHLFLATVVGMVLYSFGQIYGGLSKEVVGACMGYVILLFVLAEAQSVVGNMLKLGMPVPIWVIPLINAAKRKSLRAVFSAVGEPDKGGLDEEKDC